MAEDKPAVILFADDERELLTIYAHYFQSFGYEIRTADEGQAASRIVWREHIDVIVIDLEMPVIDGGVAIEVLADIAPQIPVIVVSGHASPEACTEQLDSVFRVLHKPVGLEVIHAAIKDALAFVALNEIDNKEE